ncbi:MAG: phenylalanine--tRNA ligase subunit beta [Alphaproteobacteria bacterium]
MKITLSWIKDYLDTNASLEEVSERLSMLGLVVDEVHNPADALQGFNVVEIMEAEKHADADRLKVCKVNTGEEVLQVVCGGPNARAGLKTVLAKPGMVIPSNGMKMKVSKIRGVESHGMLCSTVELGVSDESDGGIIEIAEDVKIGTPFSDVAGLDDPVLEIEITPNRGDCLGAFGIARDLAAAGVGTLIPPKVPEVQGKGASPISVKLDSGDCSLFLGRYVSGVTNGPSPAWMQQRLQAIGLRPISALVDITNYLAYAIGRPMHVFDADKLTGNVVVRYAKNGETLEALDGNTYTLDESMLVVADDTGPQAIAGVIGGMASGCTEITKNVFIESAVFDPISITMTGRKLKILTDSRYRFERGVDRAMVAPSVEMATDFILNTCGGQASEVFVVGDIDHKAITFAFDPNRVKQLTGIDLSDDKVYDVLQQLGCAPQGDKIVVPSWRHDLTQEADLVEEVLRIVGYDQLPTTRLPRPEHPNHFESYDGQHQRQIWAWNVRRSMTARGYNEAQTWSFMKDDVAQLFGGGQEALRLKNPISQDLSSMRPSLLPNLLEAIHRNAARGYDNVSLFEIGSQFAGIAASDEAYVAAGVRSGTHNTQTWHSKERQIDVFDAKADALEVLETCGMDPAKVQISTNVPEYYHPGQSGALTLGPKNVLGYFGTIHPAVLKAMDIDFPVVVFEIFLSALPIPRKKAKGPIELSSYQPLERDFAFILDEAVPANDIVQAIRKTDRELITAVNIFDVYQGKGVPEGKKSIACSIRLEPKQATLTDTDIKAISDKVITGVEKATGGVLRT